MMIVTDSSAYGVDGIDWVSTYERYGPFERRLICSERRNWRRGL
jgi:hypothetical protein